jgi:hypothetical protein
VLRVVRLTTEPLPKTVKEYKLRLPPLMEVNGVVVKVKVLRVVVTVTSLETVVTAKKGRKRVVVVMAVVSTVKKACAVLVETIKLVV